VEDRVLILTLAVCGWVVMLFMAIAIIAQFHVTSGIVGSALGGSLSLLGLALGGGFGLRLVRRE